MLLLIQVAPIRMDVTQIVKLVTTIAINNKKTRLMAGFL
jgi:hypothetical protein